MVSFIKRVFLFLLDAFMFIIGVASVSVICKKIAENGGVDGYVIFTLVVIAVHFITCVISGKSKKYKSNKPIKIRR
ncbi:hypothetical protein FG064_16620 [Vibrio cholerae]|nr:hypothetical protein [Vibrio cholerae]